MPVVRYYHRSGKGPYMIEGFCLREDDLEPLVLYRQHSLKDMRPCGPLWSRPVGEFFDGRFRQAIDEEHPGDTAFRGGLGVNPQDQEEDDH